MILPASQVSTKAFDYIIVGGGTSGLTLATRLSEDPAVSVLVIEAGQANLDDPEILNPALFGSRFGKAQYDWAFQTIPQKLCNDRSLPFNRGKGLGGSSALNFFQYHRPSKSDIDAIGELGNSGWNWELLERYYSKSEQFIQPVEKDEILSYDLAPHGITDVRKAMKDLGIDFIEDPTKGAWFTPMTIHPTERVRSYSANKYYQPNATRENLTVVVDAHVTRIVTEQKENGLVTAVEVAFLSEEVLYTVEVGREVVLSAGYILELSGIGNKTVLESVGIETRVHLPGVGENVQEHVFATVVSEIRPEVVSELYQASGAGIFGMAPTCVAFMSLAELINGAISSKHISPSLQKQYEIQLKHQGIKEPSCEFILWPLFRPAPNMPAPGKQCLTISTLLNHPLSRGSIHITSNDPLFSPSIDPKYFQYEYDLLQLVEQIKFGRRIFDQESIRKLLTGNELTPGPDVQTDEEIADFVKSALSTTWHTVGSCSMLPLIDGGVVDRSLKVYNTTNIRVVDMSVIPLHIGAHTQATAYALGELGADIIKGNVF
ncbi:alcohol oxidase [Mycena albidolilacea]|uniref:Alcohol oxidase n=1 Tax=Mycena albidolilacea TaxID=1033008 RepID=A0AAD6Z1R1_9AGAR|nr:alcohol oxidase [Mycena albidolilacea]